MGKVVTKPSSPVVARGTPLPVDVTVTGAKPGSDVKITLKQTHGMAPLWGPETKTKRADAAGTARETLTVRLNGPADASLLGTAYDGSTYFEPGPNTVKVT